MIKSTANIKLQQKYAKAIEVRKVMVGIYVAKSHTHDLQVHEVRIHKLGPDDYRLKCTCSWSSHGGEGCRHTLAVLQFSAAMMGKQVSFWESAEEAAKQRKKVIRVGESIWMTMRRIYRRKSPL